MLKTRLSIPTRKRDMATGTTEINQKVKQESVLADSIRENTEKTIDRQKHPVSRLLIRTLANEHVLLDVVPGPAKTISAETRSKAVQTKFQRLQFTPNFSCAGSIVTSKELTNNCLVEPLVQGGTV